MDNQPTRCPICGRALIIEVQFPGESCTDPGHWQAAGLLSARDYYPMAIIAARANLKSKEPVLPSSGFNLSNDVSF
jgi:hypothetical protein